MVNGDAEMEMIQSINFAAIICKQSILKYIKDNDENTPPFNETKLIQARD